MSDQEHCRSSQVCVEAPESDAGCGAASGQLRPTRRHFMQASVARASAIAGVGYWVAGGARVRASASPNEQLQIGCVGVHGKGETDVKHASGHGRIFALCDVDRTVLEPASKLYKTEHAFTDFREMLDRLGDQIDVVTVSTPDHCHAVIAGKAMKMGKHVYCQKPLTHSIWEARQLGEIAKRTGVVTQMGNQYTAFNPMREAAYRIRAGQLGSVSEVHVWTDRPIWPQGVSRPKPAPIPNGLNWEAWLGPAPYRPYGEGYHTIQWRGWWDFGAGALGDMACHTCNLPFMALNMRDPVAVEATTSEHNRDSFPRQSTIKYDFPALGGRAPFTLTWYDGSNLPPKELYEQFLAQPDKEGKPKKLNRSGCIIVGDKSTMYAAGDYAQAGIEYSGDVALLDVDYPRIELQKDPGHVQEFYDAIHDRSKQSTSNFADYSGPFTETVLLGNLAVWKGGRVVWDSKTLTPDDAKLMSIVKREYRYGYEV